MIRVHVFDSTSDAYDESQCNDNIKDGDILVIQSEGVIGIMMQAWPVAIVGTQHPGAFHVAKVDIDWADMDGRDYTNSVERAKKLGAELSYIGGIQVYYTSIDGVNETRSFDKIEDAQIYAKHWIGDHPTLALTYAVSDDGIGKITVHGCTLAELFPGVDT